MAEAVTAVSIDLLANDVDVEGDELEIESVTPPAHGTATLEGGSLIYTPAPGFLGVEQVAYVVADEQGATSTAQVHIGVETLPPGMPMETIQIPGLDASSSLQSPSISSDGRFVTFPTLAPLLPEDTNGLYDVYLYDRGLRRLTRASVATGGGQADGVSPTAQISGNGRYIAFHSSASNLVAGDSGSLDVFRHDRITGETVRVSVAASGGQALGNSAVPSISDDGSLIAFESTAFNLVPNDVNGSSDIFVHDVTAGTTARVSVSATGGEGDASSLRAAISGDGQNVAFSSTASNLIAGDTNGVFVHERSTGPSRSRVDLGFALSRWALRVLSLDVHQPGVAASDRHAAARLCPRPSGADHHSCARVFGRVRLALRRWALRRAAHQHRRLGARSVRRRFHGHRLWRGVAADLRRRPLRRVSRRREQPAGRQTEPALTPALT